MKHLELLIERYPELAVCGEDIRKAIDTLTSVYSNRGMLLLCGNGGSSADCDHIVGELMKGFLKKRPLDSQKKTEMIKRCPALEEEMLSSLQGGFRAVSLPSLSAFGSAFSNDVDASLTYAQATLALGREGDALIAISTSGNAQNVIAAAKVARGIGMKVIAMTGKSGGTLAELADIAIKAPATETFKVQELHLPIYHCICAELEEYFFEI